jgi:uncharacterized protein (TIGR02246 family)
VERVWALPDGGCLYMTPVNVAESFLEAINARDADGLVRLMTEDHVFVDSDGTEHRGRERMRKEWRDYFHMVPDYRIDVKETFFQGDTAVLVGVAQGTFAQAGVLKPENHWSVPAAWRVVVREERVAVWQLYVNPQPMIAIVKRIDTL